MDFALLGVHSVLGDTHHHLFYFKAALECLSKMDPLFTARGLEYLHLEEVIVA